MDALELNEMESDTSEVGAEVEILTEEDYKAICESYPGAVGGIGHG